MDKKAHESQWSPFDPQWYHQAFDKYISTADQLDNQEQIRSQGYTIPDADGSKSTAFRREAVLNNSFNENVLRDSLKDIYFNNSHRLIASNHDNVGFFRWFGSMSDMTITENTWMAEFKIPCDQFISPKERDRYKLGQYYRKWITPTDILNDWETFKWHCLLFINQKIYSEYELRIDDHEITIRFKSNPYWVKNNVPVYIYKMETNAQCRVLVSRELITNQWNWMMPSSYLSDQRVCNNRHIMAAFNKISDPEIRKDGVTHVEVLGDNLEFLTVEDGYIDLSNISNFNKIYIQSESREWLWMTIFVPKFLQEYPVLLPVDTVYRPYEPDIHPVTIDNNGVVQIAHVDEENPHRIYVDVKGGAASYSDGWKQMIRPIVLSEAFSDSNIDEPYEDMAKVLEEIKQASVREADAISDFRTYMEFPGDISDISAKLDDLTKLLKETKDLYDSFLKMRRVASNPVYDHTYDECMLAIADIREQGVDSEWLLKHSNESENNFWFTVSPLVYIPRGLVDDYEYIGTISAMGSLKTLWLDADQYQGQIRYRRPIDVTDFWTFEFYPDEQVWRPIPLIIEYHFPDVYLPTGVDGTVPSAGRIFKAFFFYSDTMNILEPVGDIVEPTVSWDSNIEEYHVDQGGVYRDIFMEKFYWMGIQSIYKGLLMTHSRWELLEYISDNPSYERFNQLFLQTMDPYFKLGMATYLKSTNFEFPFDDAISKLKESIGTKFLDYQRITNFEVYLNNSWIPSYFDYAVKILDNWAWEKYLVRRPSSSFSPERLLPVISSIQEDLHRSSESLMDDIKFIRTMLIDWTYGLNTEAIENLTSDVTDMHSMIDQLMNFIVGLDPEVYSVDDINHISDEISNHDLLVEKVAVGFENINRDVIRNNKWEGKKSLLSSIPQYLDLLPDQITNMARLASSFNIDEFMTIVNNLRGYIEYPKDDPDSLIGHVNEFNSPWPATVKEKRNELFVASSTLAGTYEPSKPYTDDEVKSFYACLKDVEAGISNLRSEILTFWKETDSPTDTFLTDKLDYSETVIQKLSSWMNDYMKSRSTMIETISGILDIAESVKNITHSPCEVESLSEMQAGIDKIIQALSYIAGTNNRDEALLGLSELKDGYLHWMESVSSEEDLFTRLLRLSTPPIGFVETMSGYKSKLSRICQSIAILSDPRNNVPQNPTYSDVYSINTIVLDTGGIYNRAGDKIYVPGVGVYNALEVDVQDGSITNIDMDRQFRITTFRDPAGNNPDFSPRYDAITDGNGLGVTIEACDSDIIPIINDTAVDDILDRIQGFTKKLERNLESYNPYKNKELREVLHQFQDMHADWRTWNGEQIGHLSTATVDKVNRLFDITERFSDETKGFVSKRDRINVSVILQLMQSLEQEVYKYTDAHDLQDQTFFYYDENIRQAVNSIHDFYGNGVGWSSGDDLYQILGDIVPVLISYDNAIITHLPDGASQIRSIYSELLKSISDVKMAITDVPNSLIEIKLSIGSAYDGYTDAKAGFQIDEWYRIITVRVAEDRGLYEVGDIVRVIPELPTDTHGNPIEDQKDVILNDRLLFQIVRVDDGHPTEIRPLLDYALPYSVWGIRKTETIVGSGRGLIIDVYSQRVTIDDSTLYRIDSLPEKSPDVGPNDLIKLHFENIHDLDIGYEVYCGGEQISNLIKRHNDNSGGEDVIYIDGNKVMNLQNASVVIPEEHHISYQLDHITIKDPGSGYSVGQDIFINANDTLLHMKVTKLTDDPYKGIAELSHVTSPYYNDVDPTCRDAQVITDSMNNIDDEYNTGYYDMLTSDGICKPTTQSYDRDTYTFVSRRFDELSSGDRNKTFAYPDISSDQSSGDPDSPGLYLGNRIDNSQHPLVDEHRYNGIIHVIPPTDPFIPVDRRFPTGHTPKGEYQLIQRQRIHSSEYETNDRVTEKTDGSILNAAMVIGDLIVNDYTDLPKHTIEWPEGKIGKSVVVEHDSSHDGHRMLYRIRTFVAAGFFVYDRPDVADISWSTFDVNWLETDSYPDRPGMRTQYPSADWETSPSYRKIQREIDDGKHEAMGQPTQIGNQTYIHDLTVDDISVFNYTTKEWEDLSDASRWDLKSYHDPANGTYGFTLTFIADVHNGAVLVRELPYDRVKFIWDNNGSGYVDPAPPELTGKEIANIWDLDGAGYVDPEDNEMKRLKVRTIWETDGDGYVEPKDELWVTSQVDPDDKNSPYSYDMRLYLNKEISNQVRNASLKRNAVLDINASISSEISIPEMKSYVDTGKTLRVRKVFPYTQKEQYTIGTSSSGDPLGYEMDFKVSPYIHFRNELHLEDVSIYNKTADRWEDVLDTRLFEVRFRDPKCTGNSRETQTKITRILVNEPGTGFINGNAWAWNTEFQTHLFGNITSDYRGDGHLLTFDVMRMINPPTEDVITLEFVVYQSSIQTEENAASIIVEFHTETSEVWGDGYIHNVTNPLAPLPEEFKVICQYNLDQPYEYEIIIDKGLNIWTFTDPEWRVSPTFHIPNKLIPKDRMYILTESGRFPLANPSTGKPTMIVESGASGTDVTYLSLYRRYEPIRICETPYPMRSVYVRRRIPISGFIDLEGKINKPLNKKYFEFWVNGKLMDDEVTIITPMKLFLHGLRSLRNFEIIEINRDPNEYFSEIFLSTAEGSCRPHPQWDYTTYLDDALEGTLEGDNYSTEEQEYLLSPVWKQVAADHPEFKNYPPNVDIEPDILIRSNPEDYPIDHLEDPSYQFMVVNQPTLEGKQLIELRMRMGAFGLKPITNQMIVDILNEIWEDEIRTNPYFPEHTVVSDEEWYGAVARLYNERGELVHTPEEAAYNVTDPSILKINSITKMARIFHNTKIYDLD